MKKGNLVTYISPCQEGKRQEMELMKDYDGGALVWIKPKGMEHDIGVSTKKEYIEFIESK